ncbi:MAG TPA: PTS sugar transporter subunit IIA, partial [Sedimenticola sp.]|nr:PTS sugar transporter subunit IIA [Sedimenticola sp.]
MTLERVSAHHPAGSKKRLLEAAGALLAGAVEGLEPGQVFERLLERERLGSTGMGQGIALPHARMAGVERAVGTLIQLDKGIDFDAIDGQPVDLVFALLVPEQATGEHLDILAGLARLFSDPAFASRLREAEDAAGLLAAFQHPPPP